MVKIISLKNDKHIVYQKTIDDSLLYLGTDCKILDKALKSVQDNYTKEITQSFVVAPALEGAYDGVEAYIKFNNQKENRKTRLSMIG